MGQRSGVGLVELAILEALDARRAWPGRRAARCLKVLAALEDEIGLARGYAYQVLIDLALPWKLPIPLVEGIGNFGGRGDDPPASAYYTEARVSPAGQVVLAAERGEIAPVPVGMINGNSHREGMRPPFRPAAVIDAIRQVLLRPRRPGRRSPALSVRPTSSPAAPSPATWPPSPQASTPNSACTHGSRSPTPPTSGTG